jgi:abortive infection bacteriophage resistance protein
MKPEKPQWQIDAEQDLDGLKDTPLVKLSAAQNNALAKGYKCNMCGKLFNRLTLKLHTDYCESVQDNKDNILALYHNGERLGPQAIAEKLNIHKNIVYSLLGQEDLPVWTISLIEEKILEYFNSSEKPTKIQIVEKFGVSLTTVSHLLQEHNLKAWNAGDGSIYTANSEKIKPLWEKGLSSVQISKLTGISSAVVRITCKKNGWQLDQSAFNKNAENLDKFWKAYNINPSLSPGEISKITGIRKRTVESYFKKYIIQK